ncbi:MAG: thymidylate synthase [bacterium]
MSLSIHKINARDLPDLWFQAVNDVLEIGNRFKIDRGSFAGQTRLEYDYFTGHVKNPGWGEGTIEILPQIPESMGIPNPVELAYVYGGENYDRSYVEYVMTARKEPGESYTYGERLTKAPLELILKKFGGDKEIIDEKLLPKENKEIEIDGKIIYEENGELYLNQINWVIDTYKRFGHRNNQMVLQVANDNDLVLKDPPCLRSIDTRIQDDKLSFFVYFRSWDLWAGLPANLAGIQALKGYMAEEIGVKDGDMIVESKGLHLYGYAEDLAKMRCLKNID